MHPGWVIICQADYYFSSSWLFCTFSLLKRKLKRRFKIISSSTTSASPLWALPLSSLCPSSVLPPSFAQESKNDIFREDMTLSPVVLSCMYWSCIMTCLSYTWVKWESGTQNSKQYLSKVHRQKTRMMRSMLSLRSGCYCIWIFSLSLFRSFHKSPDVSCCNRCQKRQVKKTWIIQKHDATRRHIKELHRDELCSWTCWQA